MHTMHSNALDRENNTLATKLPQKNQFWSDKTKIMYSKTDIEDILVCKTAVNYLALLQL